MFLVGKSGVDNLSWRYYTHRTGWMEEYMFIEWVDEMDEKCAAQERKISLTIVKCPAPLFLDALQAV